MRSLRHIGLVIAALALGVCLFLLATPAHGESLRCNGQSADVGDSRLSVLHKCGEPVLKDSFCAPFYFYPSLRLVPPPLVGTISSCQQIDEWLYDRGPGNLMATVRFQYGVVQSIDYNRSPQ